MPRGRQEARTQHAALLPSVARKGTNDRPHSRRENQTPELVWKGRSHANARMRGTRPSCGRKPCAFRDRQDRCGNNHRGKSRWPGRCNRGAKGHREHSCACGNVHSRARMRNRREQREKNSCRICKARPISRVCRRGVRRALPGRRFRRREARGTERRVVRTRGRKVREGPRC